MAVPDLGTLTMLGLAREKKYDNYSSTSGITGPISLADLFLGGSSFGSGESYETTNANDPDHPEPDSQLEFEVNGSTPLEMSAWYSYDHDYAISCGTLYTYTFGKALSLQDDPCSATCRFYRINNTNWLSATQMYTSNVNSCTPATPGFYYICSGSYPTPVRYWNGNSFTGNYGCP